MDRASASCKQFSALSPSHTVPSWALHSYSSHVFVSFGDHILCKIFYLLQRVVMCRWDFERLAVPCQTMPGRLFRPGYKSRRPRASRLLLHSASDPAAPTVSSASLDGGRAHVGGAWCMICHMQVRSARHYHTYMRYISDHVVPAASLAS